MKIKRKISISRALKTLSVLAFAIMLVIIIYMSYIADYSLRNQAATINQATLSFYRDRVDQSLTDLDRYLYDFMYNNNDALLLKLENDEQQRYLAKVGISDSLSQIVKLHDFAEGVLFYSPLGYEEDYITRTSQVLSLSESNALQQRMLEIINVFQQDNRFDTSKWFVDRIEGNYYLMRIIYVNDSYCGAWVSADALSNALGEINFGEGSFSLLCSTDGEVLAGTENQPSLELDHLNWHVVRRDAVQYIQVSAESSQCEYAVAAIIPVKGITEQWENGLQYVFLFALMFVIVLIVILLSSNFLYRPFKSLVSAMEQVENGNLDGRIEKTTRLAEFDHVYTIFNSMVTEIKNLKISIYEQRLAEEKITRQYLQMQLKSHFYLNCLNIIYSLAQVKDFGLIQQLTLCLVKYFRYMMQDAGKFAVLEDEIEHIRNYMDIQELRFPDMVEFHVDVDASCEKALVPPLMLQTFIENSIEHAIDFDQHNDIYLQVKGEKRNGTEGICVLVSDNGKGFDGQALEKLNHDEPVTRLEYEKGIGINNMKNRLKLLYGGKAELRFKNGNPHGAIVEIWLPDQAEQTEE